MSVLQRGRVSALKRLYFPRGDSTSLLGGGGGGGGVANNGVSGTCVCERSEIVAHNQRKGITRESIRSLLGRGGGGVKTPLSVEK